MRKVNNIPVQSFVVRAATLRVLPASPSKISCCVASCCDSSMHTSCHAVTHVDRIIVTKNWLSRLMCQDEQLPASNTQRRRTVQPVSIQTDAVSLFTSRKQFATRVSKKLATERFASHEQDADNLALALRIYAKTQMKVVGSNNCAL